MNMNPYTKERFLSLLREESIDGISILEQDKVTLNNIIFYLQHYRFDIEEHFFLELAKELGLPFVGREQLLKQSHLATVLPFEIIKDQLIILTQITPEAAVIVTANPFNTRLLERIEMILHKKVEISIASIKAIEAANDRGYREIRKYKALKELFDRDPDESAYRVLYPWQRNILIIISFLVFVLFLINGIFAMVLVFSFINFFYCIFGVIDHAEFPLGPVKSIVAGTRLGPDVVIGYYHRIENCQKLAVTIERHRLDNSLRITKEAESPGFFYSLCINFFEKNLDIKPITGIV